MEQDKKWWMESVVYQIYPRSFADSDSDGVGDLNGITGKLKYLQKLGVDVLWISPFYQSPGRDNGYDISDYRAIDPVFGTMEDFERLLSEAHRRGLKIVLDLVINHTSDQHAWFVESRKSKNNPYRSYYIWQDGKDGGPPNNWGALFGGPAWTLDPESGQYYLHLFSPHQPDLNWENPKLREAVYEMMRWWLDKGIDGFRMDVISLISKHPEFPDGPVSGDKEFGNSVPFTANGPRVHEFLAEMRQKALMGYDTMTVGETSGVTVEEAVKYAGLDGSELNMVFQFEHMDLDGGESFKWNLRKIDLCELKATLSKWQTQLYEKAWNSLYWCNHDQPRIVSRLGDERQFREKSAKMLATCLHMMQGTPYIYQGEELGMTNAPFAGIEDFRDLESINAYENYTRNGRFTPEEMLSYLRYKSRDNARTPMQWSDDEFGGFSEVQPWIMVNPNYKTVNAREQMSRADSVFNYYRKLIELRKRHSVIVHGRYELLEPEHPKLYIYTRTLRNQVLLVICNFASDAVNYVLPAEFRVRKSQKLIGNYSDSTFLSSGVLQQHECCVYLFEN